jgi:hypothetical protein
MKPKAAGQAPDKSYARIVRAFASDPGVTVGAGARKGFGASALATRGRIFAMLSSRDRFVVKLPGPRVDALVAAGRGSRFDPGHGRPMKEWFEAGSGREDEWLALAREARAFVGARP